MSDYENDDFDEFADETPQRESNKGPAKSQPTKGKSTAGRSNVAQGSDSIQDLKQEAKQPAEAIDVQAKQPVFTW